MLRPQHLVELALHLRQGAAVLLAAQGEAQRVLTPPHHAHHLERHRATTIAAAAAAVRLAAPLADRLCLRLPRRVLRCGAHGAAQCHRSTG